MIYIENNSHDCFYNHALEEYYMKHFDEDIAILWINSPAILIGRNQNTLREINIDYVKKHHIDVVRRVSGGGTVFNDEGNMNFTFIVNKGSKDGFYAFAEPVIEALKSLGVNAYFSGRNDILVNEKKFSGNAQYHTKDKTLHHGTLLFDVSKDKVSKALQSRPEKFSDKFVKSVSSRITTIREHLNTDMTLEEFQAYLRLFIMDWHKIKKVYRPKPEEVEKIKFLARTKYRSFEWNYGNSPKFRLSFFRKHPFGLIEYQMNIDHGKISQMEIEGDFFGEKHIQELILTLTDCRLTKEDLNLSLGDIEVSEYISGMTKEQLIEDILYESDEKTHMVTQED